MRSYSVKSQIGHGLVYGAALAPCVLFFVGAILGVSAGLFAPVDETVAGQVALSISAAALMFMLTAALPLVLLASALVGYERVVSHA